MLDPEWKSVMDEKMIALCANETWELTSLLSRKQTISCRWIYTVKFLPDGQIEHLKAWLVTKGYTKTYSVDYFETVSVVAHLHHVRILLSVVVVKQWLLYQLNIKNAFLYTNLQEDVYMLQPLVMRGSGRDG